MKKASVTAAIIITVSATFASVLAQGCGGSVGATTTDPGAGEAGADGATNGARGAPGSVVADGGSGSGADAGPGGDTTTLTCGAASCVIPSEVCCIDSTAGSFAFSCVVGATCPSSTPADSGNGNGNGDNGNTAALKCTGASNCPAGTVCCVSAPNDGATSACQPTCGPNDAQLCAPSAMPTGCAANEPCSSRNIGDWGLPPSFATCGGKGM